MTRIILVGKGTSGKDHLRDLLVSRGGKKDIGYTTRPIREGEISDDTYHYVSDSEFDAMIKSDAFYQWDIFNSWRYGSSKEEFATKDIFILTPRGILQLKPEDRANSFIIYLDISEDIRKERLLKRNDTDGVERRLQADREDFKDFKDYDIKICSPDF